MTGTPFRRRIRSAIANDSLQVALDANASRRAGGREIASGSLPDWPERRQRAHAIRAEVIANLDEYQAVFEAKVAANGVRLHRAPDAAQAIELVIGIAQAFRPGSGKLFAKSKSMVSEEIGLNVGLEAQGHRVVETDLGEYIVQLRGEKPAHIITPAVHLRRKDVGQLFETKLGIPFTDDIPALTDTARKVLRAVFLTADVGVSGLNFGVAETGTLCIVTNEGNGRMVTTLPPVHIALMGMERLVPTLDDLALMLSLLPRSATGQKMSVYTQLIHSPRRKGEQDGAEERHIIVVDNGRSRLRDSPLHEALYCIRCGACLNVCPVFREIGGHAYVGLDGTPAPYPGPIGSVVSPGLMGLEEFGHLAQASSLCGACKDACPVDIDLPKLLTRVRAGMQVSSPMSNGIGLSLMSRLGLQVYGAIASSSALFAGTQRVAALASHLISPSSRWFRLPAFTGWGTSKDFPPAAASSFRHRWAATSRTNAAPTIEVGPGGSGAPIQRPPEPSVHEAPRERARPPAMLIDRFVEELAAVGVETYRVRSSELHARLIAFLHGRGIDSVLAWAQIEGLDLTMLTDSGFRLIRTPDPAIRVGITGCAAAIAETGTLVVPGGSGQPLTASLLPEVHVAVIHTRQIVWSLEEALRLETVSQSAATAIITGPSRTADIEMTLTIGVHGPKELIAYIVE